MKILVWLLLLGLGDSVQGDWLTDPDAALAAARKTGKPVLAVAMDHG